MNLQTLGLDLGFLGSISVAIALDCLTVTWRVYLWERNPTSLAHSSSGLCPVNIPVYHKLSENFSYS